jgi:pyrimidine-nucleoside phosphorylase
MVAIGVRAGRKVVALITQMEQPLGHAVGNALETVEAIATLRGKGPTDFQALVERVAVEMLVVGTPQGRTLTPEAARQQVQGAIASGAALAKFRAFVVAQGGDGTLVDDPAQLPHAPIRVDLAAPRGGVVQRIDSRAIGLAVVALGGGRHKKGDPIDYGVGVMAHAKVGDKVEEGRSLCTIYAASDAAAQHVMPQVLGAYTIGDDAVGPLPMVLARVTANGVEN